MNISQSNLAEALKSAFDNGLHDPELVASYVQGWQNAVEYLDTLRVKYKEGANELRTLLFPSAPVDTTPKVGDTVRVRAGASGPEDEDPVDHQACAGLVGTLGKYGYASDVYCGAGHLGPLSDFEKVED